MGHMGVTMDTYSCKRRFLLGGVLSALTCPHVLLAQTDWPTRALRLVVPYPPGGTTDNVGRMVADRIGHLLGVSVVVDNKPGATAQIGTQLVANAAPDGYTILLASSSSFTILPNLRPVNFSLQDFEVIGGIADYVAVMAVRKTLPVTTIQEFIAYARSHPGELTFGSAGEGSVGHISGSKLAHEHGLDILHVPFRGSVAAVNGLLGEEIDFIIDGAITPMAKADHVRPIATFYRKRHPELPNVPTLDEQGLGLNLNRGAGWSLLVPKGTSPHIVTRLGDALKATVEAQDVQETLARGNSLAAWQPPEVWRNAVAADREMYAQLLPVIGLATN